MTEYTIKELKTLLADLLHLKSYMKDLRDEYIITTTPTIKQYNQVFACTNELLDIIEKHIELIEERAKKL